MLSESNAGGGKVHRSEAETLNMPHHGSVSETPVFRATQLRDDNLEGMDWMGVRFRDFLC